MCRGCTEIVLTFWARHMRMLSTFPTVDSSHQSLRWLSLCSCVLVKILISSCIICHWNISFFFVTYFPPLSSCLLCKKTLDSFFFFCSTFSVSFFPCLQGDPLPLKAWTVALCLKICQELSSLGHSSVSPLCAWEGAVDVYGNASVVIVMWKEELCRCWNFVFFIVLMKQPGLGGSTEGH